jgi:hypothetical protein
MSLLADALQPFLVRELTSVSGRMELMTLADVITEPTAGYDIDFNDADESIMIDFRDSRLLGVALAADCCRLSAASFQTISLASAEILQRDSLAWGLVKLYYSAFYAGHTLIRLFGEGCSFFDRSHVARLTELGEAFGRSRHFSIDSGLYRCVIDPASTTLKCTRARGGGAHEAFWGIFGSRVRMLAESVLAGSLSRIEAQAAFAQLDSFADIIRRKTGFGWLSVLRNDVQYRQQFGVWFPAQLSVGDRKILSRLATEWQRDPMLIDLGVRRVGLLGEFVSSCVFVVALCHAMLARVADRSTAGQRSFIVVGPMAFLNDIRLRHGG